MITEKTVYQTSTGGIFDDHHAAFRAERKDRLEEYLNQCHVHLTHSFGGGRIAIGSLSGSLAGFLADHLERLQLTVANITPPVLAEQVVHTAEEAKADPAAQAQAEQIKDDYRKAHPIPAAFWKQQESSPIAEILMSSIFGTEPVTMPTVDPDLEVHGYKAGVPFVLDADGKELISGMVVELAYDHPMVRHTYLDQGRRTAGMSAVIRKIEFIPAFGGKQTYAKVYLHNVPLWFRGQWLRVAQDESVLDARGKPVVIGDMVRLCGDAPKKYREIMDGPKIVSRVSTMHGHFVRCEGVHGWVSARSVVRIPGSRVGGMPKQEAPKAVEPKGEVHVDVGSKIGKVIAAFLGADGEQAKNEPGIGHTETIAGSRLDLPGSWRIERIA